MKSIFSLFAFVLAFTFTLQAQADTATIYTGKFNGKRGQAQIVESAGVYSFSFSANDGSSDLIGAGCDSSVGASKKVKVKDGEVRKIVFAFDTKCDVQGNEMVAELKEGVLRLSIYQGEEVSEICNVDQWGRTYCRKQYWPIYLTGKFTK